MQASSYLLGQSIQKKAADKNVSTTTCIRKLVLVALGASLLLQTVAISTLGWRISSDNYYSYQEGLFGYKSCRVLNFRETKSLYDYLNREFCETKSYSDDHFDKMKKAYSRTKEVYLEREYILEIVHHQVGVMVALFCTLTSFIVLLKKTRKQGPVPITLSIVATILAIADVIMGEVIYTFLVSADEEIRKDAEKDRNSVKFPHSLLFYILACNVVLVSIVVLFKCLHDDIATLSHARANTGSDGDGITMRTCNDTRL